MSPAKAKAAPIIDEEDSTDVEPRLYELCVLYPYPISQKEEADLLKEIEKMFTDTGAELVDKDLWGRRGLAYTIKNYNEGCYAIYYWKMNPDNLREIDEALRILPGVLRHMIVKPPKDYEIVKYGDKYKEWQSTKETVNEQRKREKEEALQKRVAEKAKRQVRRAAEEKKEEVKEEVAPVEKKELDAQLDKLISDDELDL